jgi:hypothetical protein
MSERNWFYADTTKLKECFRGKVALLDFDMVNTNDVASLISKFGLEDRRLSSNVKEEVEVLGEQKVLPELTDLLRTKTKFISR